MILASCSLREAESFDGTVVSGNEKVFLNIEVGSEDLVKAYNLLLRSRSVKTVTIVGGCEGVGVVPSGEVPDGKAVFAEYAYPNLPDDGLDGKFKMLVRLPDAFSNMKELFLISEKYPKDEVHFIGGKLLEIPGLHIGRFDTGKEKMTAYFDGVYDCFMESKLDELDNLEVIRSRISKHNLNDLAEEKETKHSEKKEKKTSVSKLKGSFSNLFGDDVVDF